MRLFTEGKLRVYEYLMQEPPSYHPYRPDPRIVHLDCQYCLYFDEKKRNCTAQACCLSVKEQRMRDAVQQRYARRTPACAD